MILIDEYLYFVNEFENNCTEADVGDIFKKWRIFLWYPFKTKYLITTSCSFVKSRFLALTRQYKSVRYFYAPGALKLILNLVSIRNLVFLVQLAHF